MTALKDEYVTLSEAAALAGVTRQTISRWIKEGKLTGEKIGREVLIRTDELYQLKSVDEIFVNHILDIMADEVRKSGNFSKKDKIKRIAYQEENRTIVFSIIKSDGSRMKANVKWEIPNEDKPEIKLETEIIEWEK